MNKLFLVLLALCLVSVHAFVRRETPTTEPEFKKYINDINEAFAGIANQVKEAAEKNLNPDEIKNQIIKMTDEVTKVINSAMKNGAEPVKP